MNPGNIRLISIVANGSLEHFVQVADAAAGQADAIYEEMFAICRRLLADGGRFVTTAIHFREARPVDPAESLAVRRCSLRERANISSPCSPRRSAVGIPSRDSWKLRCGVLRTDCEEDGTHDYYLTSEYWLRRLQWSVATSPRVWWGVLKKLRRYPHATWNMLRGHLWDQAWYWQFRQPAPMRLLRQTWLAK